MPVRGPQQRGSSSVDRDDPAYRGQSEYTPAFLRRYDAVILGFFLRFVWRCRASRLVEGYRQHIRDGHLDVGPGTGYFIERSGLPNGSQVTILDPNQNVLDYAALRLSRLEVTAIQADVLKPLPVDGRFNSAALHGVIHCLPGPLARKATAVTNVAAVLAPDGVLFGMSVLGSSGPQTWLSRRMLASVNRRGAFDNLGDTEEGLKEILAASFEQVELETVGSVAIFVATNPRRTGPNISPAPLPRESGQH
jgi:SAM-dependent methyltransferase